MPSRRPLRGWRERLWSGVMRIIAGAARGRRLVAPDSKGTRPVTDRVREAVFSSIGAWVADASVLDIYAGSGSFGLEALSRGAASVVFVENGYKAQLALKDNIENVGLGGTLVTSSAREFLSRSTAVFDLVFSDPPWQLPRVELEQDLVLIDAIVSLDGEIVISRRHGDEAPAAPETWRVATDRRYGDTRILRYEKKAEKL